MKKIVYNIELLCFDRLATPQWKWFECQNLNSKKVLGSFREKSLKKISPHIISRKKKDIHLKGEILLFIFLGGDVISGKYFADY